MLNKWLQIEIVKEHKTLLVMVLFIWLGLVLLCASCCEERTAQDELLDMWCEECEEMSYAETREFYEKQYAYYEELGNVGLMHVEDYRKIKLYEEVCSKFSMMLQSRYEIEQMKQFAAGETDFIEKNRYMEWNLDRYDIYRTLPVGILLNDTYFYQFAEMQKYNLTFVIAIILCCGIWSDVGKNGGFKIEKISVKGGQIQLRRHMLLLLLIAMLTFGYSVIQIALSGLFRQWEQWDTAARVFLDDVYTWMSIRQLLWCGFALQLANNVFWYGLTYILCLRLRETKKIYITVSGIVLVLYFLANCLIRYGHRSLVLIGYYQIIYAVSAAKPICRGFTTFDCGILILGAALLGVVATAAIIRRKIV